MNFNKDYKNIKKYSEKILITGLPQKIFNINSFNYDIKNNNKNF